VKACKNDAKKTLAVAFNAKQGRETIMIGNDLITNLIGKLDAFFASLPRSLSATRSRQLALTPMMVREISF